MKPKRLLIIFLALLVVVVVTRLFSIGDRDRSFRGELVEVDTARVSEILLNPKSQPGQEVRFVKRDTVWTVSSGSVTAEADQSAVRMLLGSLVDLTTQRLVARGQDRWDEYAVSDSLATRIRVSGGSKQALDLYIGRFSIQQNIQDAESYVRLGEDDEVYAVNGLLSLSFDRGFNSWRNRTVLKLDTEALERIDFTYPADSGFVLVRQDDRWTLDGTPTDSAAVARYLNRLRNVVSQTFADDVATLALSPILTLTLHTGAGQPVTVNAFTGPGEEGFLVRSSQNPEATFLSERDGVAGDLFKGRAAFFAAAD